MPLFHWISDVLTYTYTAPFYSPITLSYSYQAATGFYISQYLPYIYTGYESTKNDKVVDWRSDFTQAIANYFQPWNAIRKCDNSTGQLLINAVATNIENAYKYWQAERKEAWLDIADLNQPCFLNRIDIPESVDLQNTRLNKNLITNGGLQYDGLCRYNLPEGWTDKFTINTASIEKDSTDSVVAGGSVKATIDTGEYLYFGQLNKGLLFSKGDNLTASIWYKSPINLAINTGSSGIYLKLKLTNNDGITKTYSKQLKLGTSYMWVKDSLTVNLTEDCTFPELSIEGLNNRNHQQQYWIDALMLEKGNHASDFEVSELDMPSYLKDSEEFFRPATSVEIWGPAVTQVYTGLSGYYSTGVSQSKTPVFYVSDKNLFLSKYLAPTRVSVTTGIEDIGITNKIYGTINSNYDIPSERGWIHSATGLTTYRWPNQIDVHKTYGIAEPSVDQSNISVNDIALNSNDFFYKYTVPMLDSNQTGMSYNLNLEAFTIKDDKIWAVGLETYKSDTYRVLKIINPRTEYNKGYLELIKDYKLTGLSTGGTVTSVGFSSTNPAKLLVTMTGQGISSGNHVNLKWDYFNIDFNRRQIFTRELYTGSSEMALLI